MDNHCTFSLCRNRSISNRGSVLFGGELPPPAKIEKVLSAGNPADVLLLSSAPNKLLGLAGFNMEKRGKLFPCSTPIFTNLRKIAGKGSTLSPEKIVALQPNLIIDVGNVTPNYIDQAKRTFEQTGVPYLLLDGKLSETPTTLLKRRTKNGFTTAAFARSPRYFFGSILGGIWVKPYRDFSPKGRK